MPHSPMPPTMADREAELAALQTAFDEYISSSRELEDELDAELAKMHDKLSQSSAANMALVAQLENVNPQLSSLERALGETKAKLEKELALRRQMELAQDEAQARTREAEGAMDALRAECDDAIEQLAFKDEELEELKLELDIEKERHRVSVQEMAADLAAVQRKKAYNDELEDRVGAAVAKAKEAEPDPTMKINRSKSDMASLLGDDAVTMGTFGTEDGDDDDKNSNETYIRRLEDELEEVTEQLIETETQLVNLEDELEEVKDGKEALEIQIKTMEQQIEVMTNESSTEEEKKQNGDTEELHKALQQQWEKEKSDIQEELSLLNEELTLTQEELLAAEADSKTAATAFENYKTQHGNEVKKLNNELEKLKSDSKSAQVEVESLQKVLIEATAETEALREEVEHLTQALNNAKNDREKTLEEMEALKLAFDEAQLDAEEAKMRSEKQLKKELVQSHRREVEELESELEALRAASNSIEVLESSYTPSNPSREKDLTNKIEKLSEEVATTKTIRAELESKVSSTEKELERANKDLQKSRRELAEVKKLLLVTEGDRTRITPLPSPRSIQRTLFHKKDTSRKRKNDNEDSTQSSDFYRTHARSRSRTTHISRSRGRSSSPATIERIEYESERKSAEIKQLSRQRDNLNNQSRMDVVRVKSLEDEIKKMQSTLLKVGGQAPTGMSPISSMEIKDSRDEIETDSGIDVEGTLKSGDSDLIAKEFRNLAKKSVFQKEHNAQLLVKILSLQGNIQVCCRVRPMKISESQEGQNRVTEQLSETEVGCFDSRTQSWKSYAFDKVWGSDVTQSSVFRDVEPLALSVVDGYNACIFAYGQTGSGKTYTMEGSSETGELGISHRTIKKIFTLLEFRSQQQAATVAMHSREGDDDDSRSKFVFTLKVGMMEIYNDEVYDLLLPPTRLSSNAKKPTLDIRRSKEGTIEVPGLEKEVVTSIDDVMKLLKRANDNRATASTNLNEHSSRSHMILNVEVVSGVEGEPSNKGNLFLVDLAGSERVRKSAVEGKQLKEASHINKSLAALGNVMEALDRKASHVPYRDSKLTYLLQDCLGGNSRTMMIVAACPGSGSYDETQCALQFATRVRRINLGTAQRNVSSKNLEETVKNLSSELKLLAKAKQRADQQLNSLKRDHVRIQDRLQASTEARAKSQDEARTMTVLRKNNNEITARWQREKELRDEAVNDLENCQKELKRVQQQLAKANRVSVDLTKEKIMKEQEHTELLKELRAAKTATTAASLRARKAEALQSRKSSLHSMRSLKEPSSQPTSTKDSKDPEEVKQEVLAILKKNDPTKVVKIDAIMERFNGRESLLLRKITDRYKYSDTSSKRRASKTKESSGDGNSSRSKLALARHKNRMKNRRSGLDA